MEFPIKFRSILSHIGIGGLLLGILTNIKVDPYISYGLSAFLALTLIIIDALNALSENRIVIGVDSNGSRSYDLINNSKDGIIVTHFGNDIPTESYISLLIEKCESGVPLTRFINEDTPVDSDAYSWMNKFNGLPNYYLVKVKYKMPMDIMIFDRKIVKVSFPNSASVSSRFSDRCIIYNKDVATMFQKALDAGAR